MSMGNFNVKAELDLTEYDRQVDYCKRQNRVLNTEIGKIKREMSIMMSRTVSITSAVASMAASFAQFLPEGMRYAVQAGIQLVVSSVALMQAVAKGYEAGGVTAPLGIMVEIGAIMMATMGIAAAMDAQSRVDSAAFQMQSSMSRLQSSIAQLERLVK